VNKTHRLSWALLSAGLLSSLLAAVVWIFPNLEATQSPGEKNLGAGVLASMAFYPDLLLIPLGFFLIVMSVRELWRQRASIPVRK